MTQTQIDGNDQRDYGVAAFDIDLEKLPRIKMKQIKFWQELKTE